VPVSENSKNDSMSVTDIDRDPSKDLHEEDAPSEQQILDVAEEVFVKISE
jgi:hypothetical protein